MTHNNTDFFELLTNNSFDIISVLSTKGTIQFENHTAENILGGKSTDRIGQNVFDFVHPEDKIKVQNAFEDLVQHQTAEKIIEFRFRHENGGWVWLKSKGKNLLTNKAIKGILINSEDISRQKNQADRLKHSQQNYQTLADSTFEAIFISENGICINQNKKAEEMFGYALEEAVGKPGTDWIHPDWRETVTRQMQKQTAEPYKVLALRKDSSTFWAEIQAKTDVINEKKIRITALRDISRQLKIQKELSLRNRRYQKAEQIGRVGNWEYNIETETFWGSDQAKRIYGFKPDNTSLTTDEVESQIPDRVRVHQALIDLLEFDKPYNSTLTD